MTVNIGRSNTDTPFPQANDPYKIINIVELIQTSSKVDDDKISANFNMVGRQGAYYGNAAAYLGYIVDRGGYWRLTSSGVTLASLNKSDQLLDLSTAIIDLEVFDYAAEHVAIMGDVPRDKETASIIQEVDSRVNDTTAMRRAATVNTWVKMVSTTVPQVITKLKNDLNAA